MSNEPLPATSAPSQPRTDGGERELPDEPGVWLRGGKIYNAWTWDCDGVLWLAEIEGPSMKGYTFSVASKECPRGHWHKADARSGEPDVPRKGVLVPEHELRWLQQRAAEGTAANAAITDLRADLEAVNALAREFGHGQGELNDDLAGCLRKSFDQLRAEVERLTGERAEIDGRLNRQRHEITRLHRDYDQSLVTTTFYAKQLTASNATNAELRAEVERMTKGLDDAQQIAEIVLSSLRWTGDGYEWTGGQWDYRMTPGDAVALTDGKIKAATARITTLEADLAAANERVALAGGYHERTEREIKIEAFNDMTHFRQEDVRYLLDLVDAGRNRVYTTEAERDAALEKVRELRGALEPLFSPHGPVAGSSEWQEVWNNAAGIVAGRSTPNE